MRKKFRTKKKKKIPKTISKMIILCIIGFIFYFTFYYLKKLFSYSITEKLLKDNKGIELYQKDTKKYIDDITMLLSNINVNQPVSLLEKEFLFENKVETKEKQFYFEKQEIKEVIQNKPLVYIYNTHQTESYQPGSFKDLNVETSVFTASSVLKEKLENLNIETLLEERKISDYLNQNHLDYGKSYQASRFYLKDILQNKNPDLIIDFHRDALSKNLSTTNFNNKDYAKVMLVIGASSPNYQTVKLNSEKMNQILKEKYPKITRGIFERNGAYYNQDMNEHMILLEVGGQENTYDEVLNTVDVLAEVIKAYLGG